MLRVCICDDRAADILEIRRLAQLFSGEHPELPIQIQAFRSAYDLLDCIEETGGFDLYLLDIIMPNLTGMELAMRIRERGETAEILFLTSSREYAVDAFGVKASGYLLKPVRKADFDEAVLSCIRNLAPKNNPSLMLKTKEGLRKVHIQELVTVESFNHSRLCTLSDGAALETAGTISSLFEQLREYPCFFMPHRAYIVNLNFVNGLTNAELLMVGGKRIPVSRSAYPALKSAYMDYVMGKNSQDF